MFSNTLNHDKEKIPHGSVAIGVAKRGANLNLINPPSLQKREEEGEESAGLARQMRLEFSFSSEYPVLRYDWWEDEEFYEVLSHEPECVNITRINNGVCPLLWNHNRDCQRGIVLSASFANGRATCNVQYDDDEEGRSLYQKVLGGTRKGVSFLYQVKGEYEQLDMQASSAFLAKYGITEAKDYAPVRVAKSWEIFEVSHVSIPADPTVGVGKSDLSLEKPLIIQVKNYSKFSKQKTMNEDINLTTEEAKTEDLGAIGSTGSKGTEGVVSTEVKEKESLFSADQIKTLLAQTFVPVQEEITNLKTENLSVASENQQLRQELDAKEKQLAQAKEMSDLFRDISKLIGRPEAPMVNTLTNPTTNHPHGSVKEFIDLFDSPAVKPNVVEHQSLSATQRDIRPLQRYIHQQFREAKAQGKTWQESHFVKELESFFKSQGYLSGRAAGPTIGTSGSIGSIYLDTLSAMMRETHNQHNIFWQFPTTVYDSSSAPNKTVLIPRANYLPQPTDINDFLIADPATYNSINYVRGTSTDSQGLEITTTPVTIAQWGIGLGTSVGNRPVFIPEFHLQTALVNLMTILDRNLMQHYFAFEELFVRRQYELATTVFYNDNGQVATAASAVAAGDGGTMTQEFLNAVYAQLYATKWPTLPNGRYIACLPPIATNQLKSSLEQIYSPVTESQRQDISNVLLAATGVEIGETSGYQGSYCGFEIFTGNSWGVGAPGAGNPTVNTVTFGAGSAIAEDCFVFAPGAVGRGVALPVEMRASGVTPFQMGESYIWVSREQVAPIDLDASINASQQTRVAKLRVSRTKL